MSTHVWQYIAGMEPGNETNLKQFSPWIEVLDSAYTRKVRRRRRPPTACDTGAKVSLTDSTTACQGYGDPEARGSLPHDHHNREKMSNVAIVRGWWWELAAPPGHLWSPSRCPGRELSTARNLDGSEPRVSDITCSHSDARGKCRGR